MPASGPTIASVLRTSRDRASARHARGASGFTTAGRLTDATDEAIARAFAAHQELRTSPLTVVALGGYGRQELSFWSDVDIMVLAPDPASRDRNEPAMRPFYHDLLGLGLDLGHSYRAIDDCLPLRESDFDAWIALLDARYVCGSRTTYRSFLRTLNGSLRTVPTADVVAALIRLSEARHTRYGRSTKLLEPNIKNSSGGLRDLQTVLWIFRVARRYPPGRRTPTPALEGLIRSPQLEKLFPAAGLRQAARSADRLLRIRHQMHLHARSQHDTLEFTSQEAIAHALQYRSAGGATVVERFMRDYYDAAHVVAELHARGVLWARDTWLRPKGAARTRVLDASLRVRAGKVHLAPRARLTNTVVLRALALRAASDLEFSFAFEDTIHRNLSRLRPLRSAGDAGLFAEIFSLFRGTSDALRTMNRLGLLSRWLPEWRPLVRFFQHNQYHYYTADEHTLTVLQNAEDLAGDRSPFGDAFRSLPRRDVLYFACLFHDITKPQRLDGHEVSGAKVARQVLTRLGLGAIADDVAFLVRHHLAMEQVAFRRNLSDPVTIREFVSRFPRPELLQYLYVLTYADLSAVNKNVLTDWKRSLLTDLYRKCQAALGTPVPGSAPVRSRSSADAAELARALGRDEGGRHASLLLDESYVNMFTRADIAEHMRVLRDLDVSATLFQHWSDVTDVTLLTQDAPFVLARVCGVLYANDMNIIDATIFTREDGVVIDKFRIVDGMDHRPLTEERCRLIDREVRDVLAGRTTVEALFERHRRRWKRRQRHISRTARVDVIFEPHPSYTIIDVFGADIPGFLYRVADTLSRLECSIHFAKIATRGDGIVDAFYVRNKDGSLLQADARRAEVRDALLETIGSMYAEEQPEERT